MGSDSQCQKYGKRASANKQITKLKLGDLDALINERQRAKLAAASHRRANREQQEKQGKFASSLLRKSWQLHDSYQLDVPADLRSRYGVRTEHTYRHHSTTIQEISASSIGDSVSFNARLHHSRSMSATLVFIVFRQQIGTLQGVLQTEEGNTPEQFVRWAEHLEKEALVHVEGRLRRPPEPITGCTIHEVEVLVEKLYLLTLPECEIGSGVQGIDVDRDDGQTSLSKHRHSRDRILALRTSAMQSIFRIRAGVCDIFRTVLKEKDFMEIHTPKLQPAATESGAEVFKVDYFGRTAFLAQSPQLAKQMAISADFERVYEIGPVFRAENSNTHRHLTEYTGLDLEMEIEADYHEAMHVVDDIFKSIFEQIYEKYPREIAVVKEKFPHKDLIWLDKTPQLTFEEGVDLLNSSGWRDADGKPASPDKDLGTRAEICLGELVRDKYKTDYYILDRFPASARPFYTKLDAERNGVTNSFDVFLRGQEICTGGQRIHDPSELAARMKEAGVDPDDLNEYMQAFALGAPPHAGCGIGLERVIFLLLGLGDVRCASMFPRDPKSLPVKTPSKLQKLPHPEADTLTYTFEPEHGQLQMPLVEDLIANYGDASNTSWLDGRYEVWRDEDTGGAVGYLEDNGYAIVMGDPLCDSGQYSEVIKSFLEHILENNLRPIWILASAAIERILGAVLDWRTLSCVAEQRVLLDKTTTRLSKKERQADNAHIKIHHIGHGEDVPQEVRGKCDERIAAWQRTRRGKQVHLTDVRPWVDPRHRQYLWAENRDGEVTALVVLAQLSAQRGYQIKYALDFPGPSSGSIEALISRAIDAARRLGCRELTFGAGATSEVHLSRHLRGLRARAITYAYKVVMKNTKLAQKNEFREKFGVEEDPLYICYPHMGLGISGTRTLAKAFEEKV